MTHALTVAGPVAGAPALSLAMAQVVYAARHGMTLSRADCIAVVDEARRHAAALTPLAAPIGFEGAAAFLHALNITTAVPLPTPSARLDETASALSDMPRVCFQPAVLQRARLAFKFFPGAAELAGLLLESPGADVWAQLAAVRAVIAAAASPPPPPPEVMSAEQRDAAVARLRTLKAELRGPEPDARRLGAKHLPPADLIVSLRDAAANARTPGLRAAAAMRLQALGAQINQEG